MAFEFKLPDVGEGLHEAELLKWLVNEGDFVREDQPLMEVQTDKAAVEITSPVTATVAKLLGKVGDTLHVGSVVVQFGDGKAAAPAAAAAPASAPQAVAPAPAPVAAAASVPTVTSAAAPITAAAPVASPGGHALAAPATRKLARELGLDINQVAGSGPAGRVTPDDVRAAASGGAAAAGARQIGAPTPAHAPGEHGALETPATRGPVFADATHVPVSAAGVLPGGAPAAPAAPEAAAPGVTERIPLRGIRKVIAERMVKSKFTAPHVTNVDEIDMTELVAYRQQAKPLAVAKGVKLSFMPFIFKALTTALKENPSFNASIDDEKQEIVLKRQYHMGFALDTEAGLMVPVIKDVDKKSVFAIAAEMQDLIERGRVGKLQPDELRGSTFTVSNQGSIGGLFFTPVINYPEVAILGVGQTLERPVVRDGQVVVRQMAYFALSYDHRLIDGAAATRFLNRLKELLANPTLLMLEAM